jgi:hypothetical protein
MKSDGGDQGMGTYASVTVCKERACLQVSEDAHISYNITSIRSSSTSSSRKTTTSQATSKCRGRSEYAFPSNYIITR